MTVLKYIEPHDANEVSGVIPKTQRRLSAFHFRQRFGDMFFALHLRLEGVNELARCVENEGSASGYQSEEIAPHVEQAAHAAVFIAE